MLWIPYRNKVIVKCSFDLPDIVNVQQNIFLRVDVRQNFVRTEILKYVMFTYN